MNTWEFLHSMLYSVVWCVGLSPGCLGDNANMKSPAARRIRDTICNYYWIWSALSSSLFSDTSRLIKPREIFTVITQTVKQEKTRRKSDKWSIFKMFLLFSLAVLDYAKHINRKYLANKIQIGIFAQKKCFFLLSKTRERGRIFPICRREVYWTMGTSVSGSVCGEWQIWTFKLTDWSFIRV